MPQPRTRRHDGAAPAAELLARVGKQPAVTAIVKVADAVEAADLRARQTAAIVRLLRQAVELRRAA